MRLEFRSLNETEVAIAGDAELVPEVMSIRHVLSSLIFCSISMLDMYTM